MLDDNNMNSNLDADSFRGTEGLDPSSEFDLDSYEPKPNAKDEAFQEAYDEMGDDTKARKALNRLLQASSYVEGDEPMATIEASKDATGRDTSRIIINRAATKDEIFDVLEGYLVEEVTMEYRDDQDGNGEQMAAK